MTTNCPDCRQDLQERKAKPRNTGVVAAVRGSVVDIRFDVFGNAIDRQPAPSNVCAKAVSTRNCST